MSELEYSVSVENIGNIYNRLRFLNKYLMFLEELNELFRENWSKFLTAGYLVFGQHFAAAGYLDTSQEFTLIRLDHSLIFSVDAFSGWFTNILNLEFFFRFHISRFNGTFRSRATLLHEQVNQWRTGGQKVWR